MIAKEVKMRDFRKSSSQRLVKYITDTQGKEERVGEVRITNCASDDIEAAAIEIKLTQALNKRSKIDKTYHLLISFRNEDNPSPETLRRIEDEVCERLGYSEHQRISAVHRDTDNLHVHIAINKIHPEKLTAHTPYFSQKTLLKVCEELEKKYGLAIDNHKPKKNRAENLTSDMEKHSGIESLLSYLKKHVDNIMECKDWQSLHDYLKTINVQIVRKGAGLVFRTEDVAIKASSLNKELSKSILEKRLGEYQPDQSINADATTTKSKYKKEPLHKISSTSLWEKYLLEVEQNRKLVADGKKIIKERNRQKIEKIRSYHKTMRNVIFAVSEKGHKYLYMTLNKQRQNAKIRSILNKQKEELQDLFEKHKTGTWADWLKRQAEFDVEALDVLRRMNRRKYEYENNLSGKEQVLSIQDYLKVIDGLKLDGITKEGSAIFRIANGTIIEKADRIVVKSMDHDVIKAAIIMASMKIGNEITLNGDDDFKQKVIQIIQSEKLSIKVKTGNEQHGNNQEDVDGKQNIPQGVKQYIRERNEKRAKGFGISNHRVIYTSDNLTATYAGSRQKDGDKFTLFKVGDETLICTSLEVYQQFSKKVSIGETVSIKNGKVIRQKRRKGSSL